MNIEINLSKKSINDAIKKLETYRDELNDKNALFVKRLAQIGIDIVEQQIEIADGDSDKYHTIQLIPHSFGSYSQATIKLDGKDILFIEFGSGIHYNPSDPKHADEFGYGVGTYPDQTHAFDPNGWWYMDSTGVKQHSYGTRATAPMLTASMIIIHEIRRIAREVYGSK